MTRRDLARLIGSLMAVKWAASSAEPRPASPAIATGDWKAHFPALAPASAGPSYVYLDSAATTQRPNAVIEALSDFYARFNANPGKTQHAHARRAYELCEGARNSVANWINAYSADEIVWTRGTTEAINLVAGTWGSMALRAGDEVLLTVAEHSSNLLPWRFAAQRAGARLRFVDVDDSGRIVLDDIDRKLSERTRLLAFSHVSNVAGFVNPAAEICARARRAGVLTLVDAAQSAPHLPIDVRAIGCDFLAFSSHKMLGPMGVGVLWARRELLEAMPPYQSGSNMAHAVDLESGEFEHAGHKFGAGTPYAPGPIGLAAAIAFLGTLGRERVAAHEHALTEYALRKLGEISSLRLLGPSQAEHRIPVFSFVIAGVTAGRVQSALDAEHIAIRAGDLSAFQLLKHFGVQAAARASCYLYTTDSDIDRLAAALKRVAS